MPPKKKTAANAYHAHRERQRCRILEAARNLFTEHGIDAVTMAEITSASGLRASTVYQYFSNKDDIVWAIASEVMQDGVEEIKQKADAAPNALARITGLLEFMADQLATKPGNVRFMAQFDAMYARHWPTERLLALEAQIHPEGIRSLGALIRDGIADGSLHPGLDPDLTMHAVMNAIIGAQRRLASLGNKVEVEYGQSTDRLFRETIRVILQGLRAAEVPRSEKDRPKKTPPKAASKRRTR